MLAGTVRQWFGYGVSDVSPVFHRKLIEYKALLENTDASKHISIDELHRAMTGSISQDKNASDALIVAIKAETTDRLICWHALRDACIAFHSPSEEIELPEEHYIRAERRADAFWAFAGPFMSQGTGLVDHGTLMGRGLAGWGCAGGVLLLTCVSTALLYYIYYEKKLVEENKTTDLKKIRDEACFNALMIAACIVCWEAGYLLALFALESSKMSLVLSGPWGWAGLVLLGAMAGIAQAMATAACFIGKEGLGVLAKKMFWKALAADFAAGFLFGVVPIALSVGLRLLFKHVPLIAGMCPSIGVKAAQTIRYTLSLLFGAIVVSVAMYWSTWVANRHLLPEKKPQNKEPLDQLVGGIDQEIADGQTDPVKAFYKVDDSQAVTCFTFFDPPQTADDVPQAGVQGQVVGGP
jgi:hypothetical protein